MSDWFRATPEGALIFLRVTPNGGRDAIEAIATLADGARVLKLRTAAQPEGGRANKAAIALLARASGLAKSAFAVKSGMTARTKTILLTAPSTSIEAARRRIEDSLGTA